MSCLRNMPERGGVPVSGFSYAGTLNQPLDKYAPVSETQLWENYYYFIEQVMPVAEANNVKNGLRPDDPPISPAHGIARILTSANAIEKACRFLIAPPVDSPSAGVRIQR